MQTLTTQKQAINMTATSQIQVIFVRWVFHNIRIAISENNENKMPLANIDIFMRIYIIGVYAYGL